MFVIGVDARPLTSPLSGVSRVISRVIQYFPEPDRFRFVLYASREPHRDFSEVLAQPNVEWRQGQGFSTRFAGLWFNVTLPLKLRKNHDLDLFWGSQQVLPPMLPSGLPTVLTYYDLVLYFFPGAMRSLARWQQRAVQQMSVKRADRILSISQQTNDDMVDHFGYPQEQAAVSLLGYERLKHSRSRAAIQSSLKGKLGFLPNQNFIFAVSTIEPRKNYATLIDAFTNAVDALRDGNARERKAIKPLVIAGRRGWESEKFYERLALLEKNYPIIVLEGLSDEEIDVLYASCAFFCMASLYEGFGLPLLEALCHGRYALAADIPCFHEIGGKHARYISPTDRSAWTSAIYETLLLCQKGKLKKINFNVKGWGWERTARVHWDAFRELVSG